MARSKTIQVCGNTQDQIDKHVATLADLERVRALVPFVVANGVLVLEDEHGIAVLVQDIAESLGAKPLADKRAAIVEMAGELPKSAAATAVVDWLEGGCDDLINRSIEAGYLLGLAVGQQIGPTALKGGAQ